MVFIEYPKQGITLLICFGMTMQYPSMFQVMEPNVFMGPLMKGIIGVLCSFEDEQCTFNNIDPWCLITKYPNESIGFLVGFSKAT
jgi:hypothetical protein